tara:strand:- start:1145 stop:3025 length:1881 start_codon:yes stop_codon:yes gene_type:complete
MGRKQSPADAAWLLLKLSSQDQELYNAEMQSLQRPDPEFDWGGKPQQQLPPGPSKLTDFDPNMFKPEEQDTRPTLLQGGLKQGIQMEGMEYDPQFLDRISPLPNRRDESPYRAELRSHLENNMMPKRPDDLTDDMRVMYLQHLNETAAEVPELDISIMDYFLSAFDEKIDGGLLDLGEFGEAAEIRQMLSERTGKGPEGQTKLGQYHPHWPNPHDKAWVEHDPAHSPELAAQIEHDRKYPMSFFRQIPEMSTPGRTWIDPETGKETSLERRVPLDPYVKVTGLPQLTSIGGTGGFERGMHGGERRPFPVDDKPGMFATVPSLRDISGIISIANMGKKPVHAGIRGDPHKEPMWVRTPSEAPEKLHEIYLHDAQPASKTFDPFALIPGRVRAEKYLGETFLNENNMNQIMRDLHTAHIPTVSASLDREGKPMSIDTGRGEIDVLDYIENLPYNFDKNEFTQHLSEKYDLPQELLDEHFKHLAETNPNPYMHEKMMGELAGKRFMYNAAKTSGIDFFPTRKTPYPRDEHGFPLSTEGQQLSGNALKLLGLGEYHGRTRSSETRHPRLPSQDEQIMLNPPTNSEIDSLYRRHGISFPRHTWPWSESQQEALRDFRSKKLPLVGEGNETF